jgi:hypothetical protein
MDLEGRIVAEVDAGFDAAIPGRNDDAVWDWMRSKRSILEPTTSRRFELHSASADVRATFEVERTGAAWTIREVERKPVAPIAEPSPPEPEILRLELVAEVRFGGETSSKSAETPLRNFHAFAFRDASQLECVAVRDEDRSSFSLFTVGLDGTVVRRTSLQMPEHESEAALAWCRLSTGAWLATASPPGKGASSRAWTFDPLSGIATELSEYSAPAVKALAARTGGGFVALCTIREESTLHDELLAFDAQGRKLWSRGGNAYQDAKDPTSLFSPQDVAALPDDRVVVVETARDAATHLGRRDVGARDPP